MDHRGKRGAAKYSAKYYAMRQWCVLNPDGPVVVDSLRFRMEAEQKVRDLQRAADVKAKKRPRACLACGDEFPSEGIHHRLCGKCRHSDAGPTSVTPYIARRRA